MRDLFATVAQLAVGLVYSLGYFGVGLTLFLGGLHLPVPTSLILPLTGYLIWQGRLSFILAFLSATVGATAAAFVLYFLGRWLGEERVRRLIGQLERFKIMSTSHLDKADEMFERHGGKAILIGHLIPLVGGYISIPAGSKRMPIRWRFLVYTVIATIPFNVIHIVLGYALGPAWKQVERYSSSGVYVVIAAAAVGVVWFLLRRGMRRLYEPGEGDTSLRLPRLLSSWSEAPREAPQRPGSSDEESQAAGRPIGELAVEDRAENGRGRRLFCRVMTPERVLYDGEADLVIARIADGYIGIMANHAPTASTVEPGEIRIRQDGERHVFATSDGLFKVSENLVQILVEEATPPDEIDLDEAQHRVEEAEKDLSEIFPDDEGGEVERKRKEIERRRAIAENLVRVACRYTKG